MLRPSGLCCVMMDDMKPVSGEQTESEMNTGDTVEQFNSLSSEPESSTASLVTDDGEFKPNVASVLGFETRDDSAVPSGTEDKPKRTDSGLTRWLKVLLQGNTLNVRAARLAELNRTISTYPDAAVNYVLRGEIYAGMGEYGLAQADFEQGLMLAEAQFETSDWGFMAQTVRDRALVGLDRVRHKV